MKSLSFVSSGNLKKKFSLSLATINNKAVLNTTGFSLLEFSIVLIIIAILSALLLFKIEFIQEDTYKKSGVLLTAKSLQSAVNITHNLWLAKGGRGIAEHPQELKNQTSLLSNYGNGNVLMSKKGWPVDAVEVNSNSIKNMDSANAQSDAVFNNSPCTRLWEGLLKNTSPKVNALSRNDSESAQSEFTYLAEFNQGVCIYRYLLVDSGWRIEYDLETGRVSTFFE